MNTRRGGQLWSRGGGARREVPIGDSPERRWAYGTSGDFGIHAFPMLGSCPIGISASMPQRGRGRIKLRTQRGAKNGPGAALRERRESRKVSGGAQGRWRSQRGAGEELWELGGVALPDATNAVTIKNYVLPDDGHGFDLRHRFSRNSRASGWYNNF